MTNNTNAHFAKAETELAKARTGYNAYADDTRSDVAYSTFYAATVHHFIGETALRLHAGMTAREAHAIARRFETGTLPLADVIAQYESTHTV